MVDTEVLSTGAGAAGAMTHGMSHAGMHGCIKVDNYDVGANVRMHK